MASTKASPSLPRQQAGKRRPRCRETSVSQRRSNDAAYVPALCARHPEWHGAFDQSGMAETSRRKLLERVVADQMLICGSHFPWPGLAEITKDGGRYAYTTLQNV